MRSPSWIASARGVPFGGMSLSQPSRTIVVEPVREATPARPPREAESETRRDEAPAAPAAPERVPAQR